MLVTAALLAQATCAASQQTRTEDPFTTAFATAIRRLKPVDVAFDEALSDVIREETLTTSIASGENVRRTVQSAEVQAFRDGYLRVLQEDVGRDQTFVRLMQPWLGREFEVIRSHFDVAGTRDVRLVLDLNNRDAITVRKAVAGDTYIISLGVDFLLDLSKSLLRLSSGLYDGFISSGASFLSEQVDIRKIVPVEEFVALAPQLNPQNQLRHLTAPGGARRGIFELLTGAISLIPVVNSPSIPSSVKNRVIRSAGALGLNEERRPAEMAKLIELYSSDDAYLPSLHYYMLQDVLRYIFAHELAHIELGHTGEQIEGARPTLELAADRLAVSILLKTANTDIRAIILAIASFADELRQHGDMDGDHPFSPDRLHILFSTAGALTRNILLDVDSGASFFRVELPADKKLRVSRVEANQTMRHSVQIGLQFERMTEDAAKQAKSGLVMRAAFEMFDLADPTLTLAKLTYSGPAQLQPAMESIVSASEASGKTVLTVEPHAKIDFQLPSDFWTLCPSCAVRVTTFQLERGTAGRQQWSGLRTRRLEEELASIDAKPAIDTMFDRVFLAQALFREGRKNDALAVYSEIGNKAPSLLSPDDFGRWVASVSPELHAARTEILKRAIRQHPAATTLRYMLGLQSMLSGASFEAVDAFFSETNQFANASHNKEAALLMVAPVLKSSDHSLEGQFRLALFGYLEAQRIDNKQIQKALFDTAHDRFWRIASANGSFAARMYSAETEMYRALLSGKSDLEPAIREMNAVLSIDPTFRPALGHLARLSICEGKREQALDYILRSIDVNPTELHPIVETALFLLDHPEVEPKACPRER